jgi:hypothetical protein
MELFKTSVERDAAQNALLAVIYEQLGVTDSFELYDERNHHFRGWHRRKKT